MQCPACGRPIPEGHTYCSWCGSRRDAPYYANVPKPSSQIEQPKKDFKAPIACMIIGIIVIAAGIIVYGLAISNAFHSASELDPWNPYSGFEQVSEDVGLIFASYAMMAVGGLILLVGIILAVLRVLSDKDLKDIP